MPWTPLRRINPPALTAEAMASIAAAVRRAGTPLTDADLRSAYAEHDAGVQHWANDVYHVVRRPIPRAELGDDAPDMVHLSIKRHDRAAVSDWRDKQRIKDELVGAECEGVELYPATWRVVDTANQFHLWVLAEAGQHLGFGFFSGLRMDADPAETSGAVQRPFDPPP